MPPETQPHAPTQPMQHGHRPAASEQFPATLTLESGWHLLHMFYQIDRGVLAALSAEVRAEGRDQVLKALDRASAGAPEQLQCFSLLGHKADFGVVMAGA